GADVRYGPRLTDLLRAPDGRIEGIVLEERDRSLHRIHAGIVIGADGLRSTVAQRVEAAPYREGQRTCGVVYAFWRGLENRGNCWHYKPGISAGAIPTNRDDTCVFVTVPPARFESELHGDMEAGYHRALAECAPDLSEELKGSQPSERFRGWPGHPGV